MNKSLLIASFFTLPLLLSAQDSPAVIIVEDDDMSFEEAAAAILNDNEAIENVAEPESPPEELEEVPEEILEEAQSPVEPVLIKTEIPRPIEVAAGSSSEVILKSPWAPKPKQMAPNGWRYLPAPPSEAYPMEINLENGKKLTLSVIPHKLVPEDSPLIIQAIEPGYNPEQGYQQADSVSARLHAATDTLSEAASSLDSSIEKLSLLVNSLPK
jgi:hypothetical protein